MYGKTLADLVTAVRAEAGHALTASQGLNALETIKYIISRTQYELWVARQWPKLTIRRDITAGTGQYIYEYPTDLGFDQIREVFWAPSGSIRWTKLEFGIPEECYSAQTGGNTTQGPRAVFWDVADETHFRVWPTPNNGGTIRLKGMKPLAPLVADTDVCTLDPTAIVLFSAVELLSRAKAADTPEKEKKAQRHLQKLLGNDVSAKYKVTTLGATRRPHMTGTPYIDYIPPSS